MGDSKLGVCDPATRGIWIDAICVMEEQGAYRIEGEVERIAPMLRCKPEELIAFAKNIKHHHAAITKLSKNNTEIIIESKRLKRLLSRKESVRKASETYRGKQKTSSKTSSNHTGEAEKQRSRRESFPPKPPRRGGINSKDGEQGKDLDLGDIFPFPTTGVWSGGLRALWFWRIQINKNCNDKSMIDVANGDLKRFSLEYTDATDEQWDILSRDYRTPRSHELKRNYRYKPEAATAKRAGVEMPTWRI